MQEQCAVAKCHQTVQDVEVFACRALRSPQCAHRACVLFHVLHEHTSPLPPRGTIQGSILPAARTALPPASQALENLSDGVHGNAISPEQRRPRRLIDHLRGGAVLGLLPPLIHVSGAIAESLLGPRLAQDALDVFMSWPTGPLRTRCCPSELHRRLPGTS